MKTKYIKLLSVVFYSIALNACSTEEMSCLVQENKQLSFDISVVQMLEMNRTRSSSHEIMTREMQGAGNAMYIRSTSEPMINNRIYSLIGTKGTSVDASSFYNSFGLYMYEYDSSETWASICTSNSPALSNTKVELINDWLVQKYWPGSGKRTAFFGYAPYDSEYSNITASATTGAPVLSYTVPSDISKQLDVMVSGNSDTQDIEGDANKAITMKFNHALTAIRFAIGSVMAPCKITKISIENVNSTGTYNFSNGNWDNQGTPTSYTLFPNYTVGETGRNVEITGSNNDLLLLMPQVLPSDAKISLTVNDGKDHSLTLSIANDVWKPGYTVTYIISTSQEEDEYVLTVSTPSAISHEGGTSSYLVTSYRQTYYGTQMPVAWTTTYAVDEDMEEQTETGEIVTDFTKNSPSTLTTTTSTASATISKIYPVSDDSQNTHTNRLKNETPKGNEAQPYNLANQNGGNDIENTANCYMVNSPGFYCLPLVYGNAISNGGNNTSSYNSNTFVNYKGIKINNPNIEEDTGVNAYDAILLWQDAYHLIIPNSVKIKTINNIKYVVFYIDKKYICQGNCVIAIRDNSHNIMWSWHIWVTDYNKNNTVDILNNEGTHYYFLEKPIGYCDEDTRHFLTRNVNIKIQQTEGPKKIANINVSQSSTATYTMGMNTTFFQFGRKDPQCPSDGNGNNWKPLYDYSVYYQKSEENTVPIANSIMNPNVFYYDKSADWCNTCFYDLWDVGNTSTELYDKSTKPSIKSIYDPSPIGYKTPEPAAFTGFTIDGDSHFYDRGGCNVSGPYDKGWYYYTNVDGNIDYWHSFGFIDVATENSGQLFMVWTNGSYWSAAPAPQTFNARDLGADTNNVGPPTVTCRAYALPIRAVKE